jgi:hypothetical protein
MRVLVAAGQKDRYTGYATAVLLQAGWLPCDPGKALVMVACFQFWPKLSA